MDEPRLIAIETKLAYHEKTIRELNDVVVEQQRTIETLEAKVVKLVKQNLEVLQALSATQAPADEKPPHY